MSPEYRDDLGAAHETADRLKRENEELRARLDQPRAASPAWVPAPIKPGPSPLLMKMALVVLLSAGVLAFYWIRAKQQQRAAQEVRRQVSEAAQHF